MKLFDRCIVSSWARSGSNVAVYLLKQHLICSFPDKRINWIGVYAVDSIVKQIPQYHICHSHIAEQLAFVTDTLSVLTIRNPSDAALSYCLVKKRKFYHIYHRWYLDYIDQLCEQYPEIKPAYKHVPIDYENWQKATAVELDLRDLDIQRESCINWNNRAAELANDQTVIVNYDKWKNNLQVLNSQLQIPDYTATLPIQKDHDNLATKVINHIEVAEWQHKHREDDYRLVNLWTSWPSS